MATRLTIRSYNGDRFAFGPTMPGAITLDGKPAYYRFVRLTHEQWENSVREVLKLPQRSGLSSGFVEPLESTSIHLIMTGVSRLVHYFPFGGVTQSFADQYNEDVRLEAEAVREITERGVRGERREQAGRGDCK